MNARVLLLAPIATLLLWCACLPSADDDDDAVCEGTFTATFNGEDYVGDTDRTCGWTQGGDSLVTIDSNDDSGNQMHLYWVDLPGPGTYDVAEYTNYTMTARWDDLSFSATSGTTTIDTYGGEGGRITGSFAVEGLSTDSSTAMTASGTFDVAVAVPE